MADETTETATTKQTTFKGTIESAYGKKLKNAVNFSGEFTEILSNDAIPADEIPSPKDILEYVNTLRKNNARQKAMAEALTAAGVEKPNPNDPEVIREQMLKGIAKLDLTDEQKEMMVAVLKANAK